MKFTTSILAEVTGGSLSGDPGLSVNELLTDSRQFSLPDGYAFFAIRGKNHDGHSYIGQLYKRGIRIFIVETDEPEALKYPDITFILVKNTIEALHLAAAFKRRHFSGHVFAVTGSAGKTVVKEWLAGVMGLSKSVVRSPKSYNSQIGVPLSVWKLESSYNTGIFEAGISMPGEMEKLQRIIDPQTGIITNIGDAHQENFSDLKSKAAEKLKLFLNCSAIVYCRDHDIIHNLIADNEILASKRLIDWSFVTRNAAIFVKTFNKSPDNTSIRVRYENHSYEFVIPFIDRASVENAITVAAVCLSSGIKPADIRKGFAGLVAVAMRMELKNGINGCLLIEDYYNSDPGSLIMALEYLKSQNSRKPVLILSDFLQSGRNKTEMYGDVAKLLTDIGINRFIGIGRDIMNNSSLFPEGSRFFYSTDDLIRNIQPGEFRDEVILLKGARVFEFEKISRLLELQVHQTVLEVNMDAISFNLNEFRKLLRPQTRIMVMVKAFAYGAGPAEIASLLEYHRIDYLAVAYADEGVELREAGVSLPIMVMNPEYSAFELIIKYGLEPEIYSLTLLRNFSSIASRHGMIGYPVHIKIDTGMHRLGFLPLETEELIKELNKSESLKVMSVFSHLAASEDPHFDEFTRNQAGIFLEEAGKIRDAIGYNFLRHILNSSGIARFPEFQFEMVRPGIGIYGIGTPGITSLKPAGRFKTRISQVKIVAAGEPVGYGLTDISADDRVIAVLPVGYADGLKRKLGNGRGRLWIKGRLVPITGNVCMDMCMADVTGLDAVEGDEAEIFGTNIKVEDLAKLCDTIPYEVLTSIPPRVKRIFYRE